MSTETMPSARCYLTLHKMEAIMNKYIRIDVVKVSLKIYVPKSDSDVEIKNSAFLIL